MTVEKFKKDEMRQLMIFSIFISPWNPIIRPKSFIFKGVRKENGAHRTITFTKENQHQLSRLYSEFLIFKIVFVKFGAWN